MEWKPMLKPVDPEILALEQQLAEMTGGDPVPPADVPEEAAPVETPAAAEEEAAAPEPTPEPEPTEDEQLDYRALAEKLQSDIEKLQAHNSRLAGKVGYLESRKAAAPVGDAAEPEYNPDPHAGDPDWGESYDERISRIEQEMEASKQAEAQRMQAQLQQIDQRVAQHATRLMAPIDPDIRQTVFQAHADEISAIENYTDPQERETAALEIIQRASLEAQTFQMGRNQERAAAAKQASTAANHRAKMAQTPSGSGGVPQPPPRPKGPGEMTAQEADQWMRENVR